MASTVLADMFLTVRYTFTGWQQCTSAEPLLKQEHCQNAPPPAISTGEKQAFAMQFMK